jgi:hypothetical protein
VMNLMITNEIRIGEGGLLRMVTSVVDGGCHDEANAEWIVIGEPLRGLNDMPLRRPTPGPPIGRPGAGHLQGVFGVFSYY